MLSTTRAGLSRSLLLVTAASAALLPIAASAQANDPVPAAEPQDAVSLSAGEIVVTARKRAEAISETPLSIQAFTAEDIAQSGVTGLQELSRFTPSLNFVNGSQGQGGRVLSEVRFRGLSTNVPTPTNQTGSVFVDGIFVLGGAQSIGFEDIERVEIIKGPQAAYFGRSTFGGAVNYVTRDPKDTLGGSVSVDYSPTFGSFAVAGSLEGPIIADILSARITASSRQKGAQYIAADGGEMGRERTDSVSGTLLLKPADGLRIKLRGNYIEDNDGPAASGYLAYTGASNCPAGTKLPVKTSAGNYTTSFGRDLYCGNIPFNASLINSNTSLSTLPATGSLAAVSLYDVLVNNSLNDPILAQAPRLKRMGMTRWMMRLSGSLDYDISDQFSFAVAGGFNKQKSNTIRDTDGTSRPAGFQAVPMTFQDASAEARLRFDNNSWLSASLGANWFNQKIIADTDNGVSVTNQTLANGVITRNMLSSVNNENDKITTKAVFFGADITPIKQITLTLEGRYQVDDYTKFGGTNAANNLVEQNLHSSNFTPRVILSTHPVEDMTVYASYSLGVLPGAVNTAFLALNATQKEAVLAAAPNLQVTIDDEKLKSYEVGFKKNFRSLGLQLSIAAFKMDWENLKGTGSVIVPSLSNPVFNIIAPGSARIKGVEVEAFLQATPNLNLRASGGYLDARYIDFAARGFNTQLGVPTSVTYKADGNHLPRNPRTTVSGSATWSDTLGADWGYRIRGDVLYTGKQYIVETNVASIAAYTTINLSMALEKGSTTIELYARNLFNKQAWLSGRQFIDISQIPLDFATAGQGAFLTPIDKREVGLSLSYKF